MLFAEKYALTQNCTFARLETHGARDFYEKLGDEVFETLPNFLTAKDGHVYPGFMMRKILDKDNK